MRPFSRTRITGLICQRPLLPGEFQSLACVRLDWDKLPGPGRDEAYAPPPGQVPACAANAPGSTSLAASTSHHSGPGRLARPYPAKDWHLLSFAGVTWRTLGSVRPGRALRRVRSPDNPRGRREVERAVR